MGQVREKAKGVAEEGVCVARAGKVTKVGKAKARQGVQRQQNQKACETVGQGRRQPGVRAGKGCGAGGRQGRPGRQAAGKAGCNHVRGQAGKGPQAEPAQGGRKPGHGRQAKGVLVLPREGKACEGQGGRQGAECESCKGKSQEARQGAKAQAWQARKVCVAEKVGRTENGENLAGAVQAAM